MRTLHTASSRSLDLVQAPALHNQAPAPPPGTDIYLVPLTGGLASMKAAKPTPVSAAPGYDNQPNFSADGNRILFAANRDGKQIDVFVFDRSKGSVTQLTQTAENENSPTYPAGGRWLRRQLQRRPVRVRQVGRQAGQPDSAAVALQCRRQVTAIDPRRHQSGGLSRVDGRRPAGAVRARRAGQAGHVADRERQDRQGRGRRPTTSADRCIAFPARGSPASFSAKRQASSGSSRSTSSTKKIDPLVKAAEGSSDRDYAWMPDGKTILMSAGTKIMSWTRGAPAGPKCSTPRRISSARSRGLPCRRRAMRSRSWWRSRKK